MSKNSKKVICDNARWLWDDCKRFNLDHNIKKFPNLRLVQKKNKGSAMDKKYGLVMTQIPVSMDSGYKFSIGKLKNTIRETVLKHEKAAHDEL